MVSTLEGLSPVKYLVFVAILAIMAIAVITVGLTSKPTTQQTAGKTTQLKSFPDEKDQRHTWQVPLPDFCVTDVWVGDLDNQTQIRIKGPITLQTWTKIDSIAAVDAGLKLIY